MMELMPDVYLNSLAPTKTLIPLLIVNNHGAGVINPEVFTVNSCLTPSAWMQTPIHIIVTAAPIRES